MIRYQHLPGRYTPNSRYSTHSSQSPNVNKRNLHHLPTISLFPIHSKTTDKAASSFYLYFLTSIHYKWAFGLTASMKQLFSRSSMTPIFFLSQWLNFSDLTFFFLIIPQHPLTQLITSSLKHSSLNITGPTSLITASQKLLFLHQTSKKPSMPGSFPLFNLYSLPKWPHLDSRL